jgi:predicted nucleic acid-binding protein
MNGRFFLDTNIFVSSFDVNSPRKTAQARTLIRIAIETRGGIVSYQVVQEFFNVALRRFSKPMSVVDREQYLSTTFRPLLSVHSSQALYGEALRMRARFQLPWYDSLMVASAIEGRRAGFTAKTFRMDGRLEASRSPTPLSDRRASLGISNRSGKKTTARREHPPSGTLGKGYTRRSRARSAIGGNPARAIILKCD